MDSRPFWEWVNERHAIYIRKAIREGVDPDSLHVPQGADLEECDPEHLALWPDGPLTADPVLGRYRFCNVFRELDRVTVWIRENIREPYADHPDLWFMLAIARTVNWPPTLQELIDSPQGWPGHSRFEPQHLGDVLDRLSATGTKVYTGAYMIRAESNPKAEWRSWTKNQYLARIVLGRLWEDRTEWAYTVGNGIFRLQDVWARFQLPRYIGWGPFMAYQVVVDLRHTRYLRDAPDINTWAALGPGSRRGLNRLAGRPLGYPLRQEDGLAEMLAIWAEQDHRRAPWVPPMELSDIQNALCETDKYLRASSGEGRPRAMYVPWPRGGREK